MTGGDAYAFTVVTYNLRTGGPEGLYDREGGNDWASRLPRVKEMMRRLVPDLLGVQELWRYQINDMLAITGFEKIGVGRDGGDDGEFSAILYNPQRFEVLRQGTFWLSETPERVSKGWDGMFPRVATWGLFKDRTSGRETAVYNTHLDHRGEVARLEGVRLILKHQGENFGDVPVVLMGDFNARPDSAPVVCAGKALGDARGLSLSPPEGPAEYTFTNFKSPGEIDKRTGIIDYILVSADRIAVLSHKADDFNPGGRHASDHLPVAARLRLK